MNISHTRQFAIFGGTGKVGRMVIDLLLLRGADITVLARDRAKLKGYEDRLTVISGNVLNRDDVSECLREESIVIIVLGFNESSADTMSRGTDTIVEAMKQAGCKRLICLSAFGAGDSWNNMPNEFKEMVNRDPILSVSFRDHGWQEEIVERCGLDWTIVRPTEIIDGEAVARFFIDQPDKTVKHQIPRGDVAQFIADESTNNHFIRRTVTISE